MEKGFTLVEMLVVLGIIVIITGIVIFNISSQKQNAALIRTAQKLSLNLRQAQAYALSAKVFKDQVVPCGWGIHFNGIGSSSYVIFADMSAALDCSGQDFIRAGDGSEDFETIKTEAGVKISGLSGELTDIIFIPPDPTVKFTPDQLIANITLVNNVSAAKVVSVNKTGFIHSP